MPTSREYLELNSRFLGQPDKSRAVGRGPRLAECAFWDVYLPQLVEKTGSMQSVVLSVNAGFTMFYPNS